MFCSFMWELVDILYIDYMLDCLVLVVIVVVCEGVFFVLLLELILVFIWNSWIKLLVVFYCRVYLI